MSTEHEHITFEELYSLYHLEIFRKAFGHTGNRQDAEDVTQECFLKLLKGLHKDNGNVTYVRNWLHAVCTHACIDLSRKRTNRHGSVSLSAIVDDEEEDFLVWLQTEDFSNSSIRKLEVEQTMSKLKAKTARLLQLHHMQGYPLTDIGQMFGVPLDTIKTRVHRARKEFRTAYERISA